MCFNYSFPQKIDEHFFVISDDLDQPVGWKYDAKLDELQHIICPEFIGGAAAGRERDLGAGHCHDFIHCYWVHDVYWVCDRGLEIAWNDCFQAEGGAAQGSCDDGHSGRDCWGEYISILRQW